MMKNEVNFNRITKSLLNQTIYDIFEQFFKLEDFLDHSETHVKEWIIIKLVTIIEQFCRDIVKYQVKNKIYTQLPEQLRINISDLERAKELQTGFLIASQYNFQNTSTIITELKNYKIDDIFVKNNKHDITELFNIRHDIVHTISVQDYDVKKGYVATQKLLQQILGKSSYGLAYYDIIHGLYFGKCNDSGKAMNCFMRALKIEPHNIIAHYYVGLIKCIEHDGDGAYDRSTTIIHLNPKKPLGYYLQGFARIEQQKYPDAINCFEKTIQLQPKNIDAHYQKCMLSLKLNDSTTALSSAYIVFNLDQKYKDIVRIIAKILSKTNEPDASLKFLDAVINSNPDYADAYYEKYVVLSKLGKNDEAKQCLNDAVRLEPDIEYELIPPNDKNEDAEDLQTPK